MSVSNLVVRKRLQKRKSSQQDQLSSQDLLTDPFGTSAHCCPGISPIRSDASSNPLNPGLLPHCRPSGRRRGNVTQAGFRWITWARLLTVLVSSATSRNVLAAG